MSQGPRAGGCDDMPFRAACPLLRPHGWQELRKAANASTRDNLRLLGEIQGVEHKVDSIVSTPHSSCDAEVIYAGSLSQERSTSRPKN